MTILRAIFDQLAQGAVQSIVGLVTVAAQLVLYILLRQTRPHIRFHEIKDSGDDRVTFLIRNLDSVPYHDNLVVVLEPRAKIEWVGVHAGPYCQDPPVPDGNGGLTISFEQVPADATFSIKVEHHRGCPVRIRLAESSPLRPRNFDDKLEPFRGVRRFSYFFARGLAGVIGFATVVLIGLYFDGDGPSWSDWPYLGAGVPLALAVFVLVVPAGGKPIVAGYLGWSGASKDWWPPLEPAAAAHPVPAVQPEAAAQPEAAVSLDAVPQPGR